MANFLSSLFGRAEKKEEPQQPISELLQQYDEEYIRYCIEQEQTVSALEAYLHTCDDPKEIAMQTLKTACNFYGGNWAGILEVDLEMDVWTPVWWHNPNPGDRTLQLIHEFEAAQFMPSWIQAMSHNEPIILPDVSVVKKTLPKEYEVYQRLQVDSIIATPFAPNPVGFLAIRNPKRYINRPSMMNILAYVLHRAMAQQKTLDSARMSLSPEAIQSDKDIIINFFGSMEVCTSKGVLREQDFKSPKSSRVATYLMLHRRATHPPLEIASALWPDDTSDPEAINSNIRGYIYRFRQAFSLISEYPLIESTPNGYRINPDLHIMTDLQQFDMLWESAQKSGATSHRVELLKQAFALYRGPVFENASGEHWIMALATHYSLRYMALVNELLSALALGKDYAGLQLYAAQAFDIMPNNVRIRYWIIYAMYHLGAVEMAKGEVEHAKVDLTAEEYATLVGYLKQCKELPPQELFGEKMPL